MNIDLRLGDCLEVLKTIPDNSIDSVVTDPPYHLTSIVKRFGKEDSAPAQFGTDGAYARASKGFMGKEWDGGDIAFRTDVWEECLRILKPGGHLLAFSHSRTYHRMAVAVEDAGFEIRDQIMWVYGSGFPKSHNIKKQIEKEYSCQFIENAKNAENKSKLISVELIEEKTGFVLGNVVIIQEEENENKMVIGGEVGLSQTDTSIFVSTEDIEQNTTLLLKNRLEEILKDGNKSITSTELKMIIDLKIWNLFQYQNTLKSIETQNHTALKPAHEPIVMARKPLSEKSIAENVLKHGTGGINIDGSRIKIYLEKETATGDMYYHINNKKYPNQETSSSKIMGSQTKRVDLTFIEGRFPANIIFDEEAGQLLDKQSDKASRFFYCPKAAKKDRNEGLDDFEEKIQDRGVGRTCSVCNKFILSNSGPRCECGENRIENYGTTKNNHPTVKPTDLMRYLINLITPPNGTILDPFMGSGSTGKAAVRCGLNFIGIEKEQEYMDIAKARIEHEKNKPIQQTLFDGN
jgi:DNA modification methylase